jgi:hypothetical protein
MLQLLMDAELSIRQWGDYAESKESGLAHGGDGTRLGRDTALGVSSPFLLFLGRSWALPQPTP